MCLSLNIKLFNNSNSFFLIYSNTNEGVCSASILTKVFERSNLKLSAYCLEYISEEFINEVNHDSFINFDSTLILSGFNSIESQKQAEKLNFSNAIILSIDTLVSINFKDKIFKTTSVACKSFFLAISKNDFNEDLAEIVLIALQEKKTEELQNIKFIKEVAKKNGLIIEKDLVKTKANIDISLITNWINSLITIGFKAGGVDIAIKGLVEGFDERYSGFAEKFKNELYQKLNFESKHIDNLEIQTITDSKNILSLTAMDYLVENLTSKSSASYLLFIIKTKYSSQNFLFLESEKYFLFMDNYDFSKKEFVSKETSNFFYTKAENLKKVIGNISKKHI